MSVRAGTPNKRRGRPRREDRLPGQPSTRDAILEAAADLFATRGFEYATLNDIAAAAGLSGGSVYNHFRGKPELFLEVVRATLSALSVKPYLTEHGGAGPELLSEVARRLLGPGSTRIRALIREVRYAAVRNDDVAEMFDEFHADAVGDYTRLIRGWQAEGLAEKGLDPEMVAQLYLAELLGLCHVELVRPSVDLATFQPLVDAHLDALLTLREQPARPTRRRAKPA